MEVRLNNGDLIVFDAGTGIRSLGEALMSKGESVKAFIAISHPHWDHIQGLPFFKPLFISGNEFTIIGYQGGGLTLRRVLGDQMDKKYFPIQLNELKAKITFLPVKEETVRVFNANLTTCFVNHPRFALGYRLEAAGRCLVYISDNEPFDREVARSLKNVEKQIVEKFSVSKGNPNQRVFDFARGADVLIHDATYTPEEYVNHVGWGHSHYLYTLEVAENAKVKKLVLFHHDQAHTDDKVDEILQKCRKEIRTRNYAFECLAAAEGMEMEW